MDPNGAKKVKGERLENLFSDMKLLVLRTLKWEQQ